MNFNIGEWIVEALKLFKDYKALRRMFYATIGTCILIFGCPPLIQAIAKLVEVLK